MKTEKSSAFAITVMLASLLCFLPTTLAAARAPELLADVEVTSGLATFQPLIAHSQVRVTVTGPDGFEVVKTFGAGEVPAVELPGTDGLYKYELRFAPVLDREARERLAAARAAGTDLGGGDKATDKRTVQRGSFSLAGGSVVPDRVELEPKVVLTNGDGVIRNSLCVGFDCPDAPVFSDSTILLMENNTRIKFGDTSNAPFPNNDWEIEANSSLSGGANYLGFNDCGTADNDGGCADDLVFAVESGARQSALYVESDGDVGIGTSNPVVDLHIVTGNTPTLRLDQDGSSGFAPQVWDIAGNETNFFVRDVTNGSSLPFRIRPGAPTSSIDVAASGNVGIGTSSPDADLDIEGSGPTIRWTNTGPGGTAWDFKVGANNGNLTLTDDTAAARIPVKINKNADNNLFRIGNVNASTVDVNGTFQVTGSVVVDGVVVHPDYVFESDYKLESIADHAALMWQEKHLPALPKASASLQGPVNLVEHQMGMLEELEKAHIYIEQLHKRLDDKEAQLSTILERLNRMEQLLSADDIE